MNWPVQAPSMLLITGTDTGVGKTWTGCALARALRRSDRRVVAVKPLESGCPGPKRRRKTGPCWLARRVRQSASARGPRSSCRGRPSRDDQPHVDGAQAPELNRLEVLGLVLTAPEQPDASTGSNAAAISRLSSYSRILSATRAHDQEAISDWTQEVTQWLQLA